MSGRLVEDVELKWHCNACGKCWNNYQEMRKDDNIESDLDYDQFIYFHKCD